MNEDLDRKEEEKRPMEFSNDMIAVEGGDRIAGFCFGLFYSLFVLFCAKAFLSNTTEKPSHKTKSKRKLNINWINDF